ncbi:MAG: M56 family metallopeptidase [Planctomycetes bacterium]|nr:M56 family metallopeptidase [Planctomycetota bacterium]
MNTAWLGMDCQTVASAVMAWLGQALFYGTILAALTWMVVRLLGRRLPPAVEALLWILVLVKFLVPAGPSCSLSLGNAFHSLPIPAEVQAFPIILKPAETAVAADPLPPRHEYESKTFWPLGTLAGLCYIACVAGLVLRRLWCHCTFLAWCRSLPPAGSVAQNLVSNICRSLGMNRTPMVRISPEVSVTFITGLFRPSIVLSHHQLVRPDELESVILHEVAHLRRGDLIVRYLQWFAGSLLFFWPVVAWVNRRIDLARELACDEWALSQGKLAAGKYARCVLNASRPMRPSRLACHCVPLAVHYKNIERRIDMILDFSERSLKRRPMGLLTLCALLLWSGFALTGASEMPTKWDWPATEDAVKEHAAQLYDLVAEIKFADMNNDGVLTYVEKDTYLVALAMMQPKTFMEAFPYADRNHSDILDYLEVYGVIRGITLIAYADRRPSAEQGDDDLDLVYCHEALKAQQWLLDHKKAEPPATELDNIWSILVRTEGPPDLYHHRMLDHGGPESDKPKTCKGCKDQSDLFHELDNNIKGIKTKLDRTSDPIEAAKLDAMLAKLETILEQLKTLDE